MTENQKTIARYMEGFRSGDREQILSCLTDDVEWAIPGAFHARGKDAFAGHIVEPGFVDRPTIHVARLIEEDDVVVAEGSVRTRRSDGAVLNLAFCVVSELEGGRIRRLSSYLMQTE